MDFLTPYLIGPILVLAVLFFVAWRLRSSAGEAPAGRRTLIAGSLVMAAATAWQIVKMTTAYGEWFIPGAYVTIDLIQYLIFGIGLVMFAVGLALMSDYWQARAEDLSFREGKQRMLAELQAEAGQPYHLLQFLEIALGEVLRYSPDTQGAIFLAQRSRRQLVLAASKGLGKKEIAGLEHHTWDGGQIGQTLDVGQPLIFGRFELTERSGGTMPTRFESSLVVPMLAGRDPVGAIVLLATEPQRFSHRDVQLLGPVAGWLGEKVRGTRTVRELSATRKEVRQLRLLQRELVARLEQTVTAFGQSDITNAFCRAMVGWHGADEVSLISFVSGELRFRGSSRPLQEFSENYRTALIEALGRARPLIINQEGQSNDHRRHVALSTLVIPSVGKDSATGMVLRCEGSAFEITAEELRIFDVFAQLAAMAIKQAEVSRMDLNRRGGIRRILELLRFDSDSNLETSTDYLADHLEKMLPSRSRLILMERLPNGALKATAGRGFRDHLLAEFDLLPGEGLIGRAVINNQARAVAGMAEIDRALEQFEASNREAFYQIFGEHQTPALMVVSPITRLVTVTGAVVAFVHDANEEQQAEWERLITLAVGLFSFRQTIAALHSKPEPVHKQQDGEIEAELVNRLNNHLAAIIGNAELARGRPDLSGEVVNHIDDIIDEAERTANFVKAIILKDAAVESEKSPATGAAADLNSALSSLLTPKRISGNLYMLGETPREISLKLRPVGSVALSTEALQGLGEGALNLFSHLSQQDEELTLSSYRMGQYVYLDISRHPHEVPAIERVAGLAEYSALSQIAEHLPLGGVVPTEHQDGLAASLDSASAHPAYLSLRFRAALPVEPEEPETPVARILAIDDQEVILELIAAMGRSAGYQVNTTSSADECLQMISTSDFDVVLIDLSMPDISGMELAAKIRQQLPNVPILLLTGWEVAISNDQLKAAGISAVLHKPFRIEHLTEALARAISVRGRS